MKRSLEIEAFIRGVRKRIAGVVLLIIFTLCLGTGIGLVGYICQDTMIIKASFTVAASAGTLAALIKMSNWIIRFSQELTGLKGQLEKARFIEFYPERVTDEDKRRLDRFILHYTDKMLGVNDKQKD